MATTKKTYVTASTAYAEARSNINSLIETLQQQLRAHDKKTFDVGVNWALAGDLNEVENRLRDIVGFLR
jgi:hypothetical protein